MGKIYLGEYAGDFNGEYGRDFTGDYSGDFTRENGGIPRRNGRFDAHLGE